MTPTKIVMIKTIKTSKTIKTIKTIKTPQNIKNSHISLMPSMYRSNQSELINKWLEDFQEHNLFWDNSHIWKV